MGNRTALYDEHLASGAKIVDFAGWDMPIHYGSQIEEHHQVRNDAGMFDVSHMTIIDLTGEQVRAFLHKLVANNVDKLKPNQALYTCMLNAQGGVIDDLIIYFMNEVAPGILPPATLVPPCTSEWFRIVVNAATREKDLAWIIKQAAPFHIKVKERAELAMIAVQGPHARAKFYSVVDEATRQAAEALAPFYAANVGEWFIGRTGYTGEDGFEILLPGKQAVALWRKLLQAGVKPVGLGARDTLPFEAGMNLYGADMDETITPLEAGLAWTVAWEPATRQFIGDRK